MSMERVSHELSVLARAVAYKNLSGAAHHVGVSQPQLSRIVKRIEETFSIVLLDRSAKRNATWTPAAFQLAEFYSKKMRVFERELDALIGASQARQLQVGTLEGLALLALPFVHVLLEKAGVRLVEVDVVDLDRLEELFTRGDLDLVFTSREPGKKKFRNLRTLGYQSLDPVQTNPHFQVMSTFEYGSKREKLKGAEKVVITNSLTVRRGWFQKFGGEGTLPSEPRKSKSSARDTESVLMIGADTLSPVIWKLLEAVPV
jgi:LysR family transcriptional regulator, transcriptional activator for aaeXAB operon